MKYYCGLDVSLNSAAICIVNQDGDIIQESEVPAEPSAISRWLKETGLPMERIGLEAGGLTPWICHELLAEGWPAICIETRHAKAAMKAQQMKTDRNDARGLAHMMRTGWFREVHVKSHESQKLRVLMGNRRCLLSKRIDIDSHIRGTLKVFGLKAGKATERSFDKRVRELIQGDTMLQACVLPMLEARGQMREQCAKLEKMILDYVREDVVCQQLMSAPGVGPLTALAFKTFVDRPERFTHSKAVGAAIGLTPRKYASGEVDFDGHITKCGDPFVRWHLFEAAKSLLRQGKSTPLRTWGLRIARRSSTKKACVAVARRLAVILHAMWRDGTFFQMETTEEAV